MGALSRCGGYARGLRDWALVVLMLFAGLRIGEAVALDVDDVTISARKGVGVVRSGKATRTARLIVARSRTQTT